MESHLTQFYPQNTTTFFHRSLSLKIGKNFGHIGQVIEDTEN